MKTYLHLFCALIIGMNTAHVQAESTLDPDQDGFTTEYEILVGTDPEDFDSRPTLADNQHKILAYWPLATNAAEAFGSGLDGDLRNSAKFKKDVLVLDGKSYVNFGNSPSFQITNNLSYCLWFSPEGQIGMQRVIGRFESKYNNRSFATFLGQGERIWTFLSDDGSCNKGHTVLQTTDKKVIQKKSWQHLAVTWNATNTINGLATYLNGMNLQMYGMPSSNIDSINAGDADLTLGTYDVIQIGGKGKKNEDIVVQGFKGKMAQLVLCDEELSDLEVRELYFLGQDGDLFAYVSMDSDNDGMPDWWERLYFQTIGQSATDDFDNDGLSNLEEYNAQADPSNYDTDGDLLSDGQEVHVYHTNPLDQDSDDDGILDGVEVQAGADPTNALSYPAVISGSIAYSGRQIGPVRILAATSSVSWASSCSTYIDIPGSYALQGIPNLTDYWIKSWRDSNRNGLRDSWEATGEYPSNPLTLAEDINGINLALVDPDVDSDGMPDWWEIVYLGHINADPEEDPDKDGVKNIDEYLAGTDPLNQDADRDGWPDSRDNMVSRAFIEWGQPEFTQGDDNIYTRPDWLIRAYKKDGEWIYLSAETPGVPSLQSTTTPQTFSVLQTTTASAPQEEADIPDLEESEPDLSIDGADIYMGDDWLVRKYEKYGKKHVEEYRAPISRGQYKWLIRHHPMLMPILQYLIPDGKFSDQGPHFNPAEWHVPATEPDGVGSLNIEIDRTIVTGNLQMRIKLFEHPGGTIYVDLLTTNYIAVASDIYGNINSNSNDIATHDYTVPLASYPSAAVIRLRRGTGEITVGEMLLWIDQDGDGLDAGQEAMLGTSDLSVDSDGDGIADNVELDQGTNPADTASFLTTISGTVTYTGSETGKVYIAVNSTTNAAPNDHQGDIPAPGAYTVSGIPTLTNYFVKSWLDFNGNGACDPWEPSGSYAGNPLYIAGAPSGIDISLADALDSDGDGLADAWEEKYFANTTIAIPTEDPDGDTVDNITEYYQGTNPRDEDSNGDGINDGGSYVHIKMPSLRVSGDLITLQIAYPDSFTNRLDVFSSTDLLNKTGWKLESTESINSSSNILEWTDSTDAQRKFYYVYNADYDQDADGLADGREKLIYGTGVDKPDTDGDTLSDGDEVLLYGTSPTNSDTDSDGMPDGWEVSYGLNPLFDDALADPDADGLNNLEEYQNATLPNVADTDGDGLSDGEEVLTHGTNPKVQDSDGDSFSDYREVVVFRSDPNTSGDLPPQQPGPSGTVYYGHPGVTDTSYVYSTSLLWKGVDMGRGWIVTNLFLPDLSQPSAATYFGKPDYSGTPDVFVHSLTATMWNKTDTGKGWIRHGGIITDYSQPSAMVYYGRPDYSGHPNMFVFGYNATLWNKVDMGKGWVTTTGFEPDTNELSRQIYYTRPDYAGNPTHWVYTYDFRVGGWYDIGKGWLRARSPVSIIPDLAEPSRVVYYGLPGEVGSCENFIWSYSINMRDDVIQGQGWITPYGLLADLNSTPWPIYYGNIQGHPDKLVFARTTIGMENWEYIGQGWINMQDYILNTEASPDVDGDGKPDGYDPFSTTPPEVPDDSYSTELLLTVGDVSESHTEMYALHVGPCDLVMPDVSSNRYLYSTNFTVLRGKSYKDSYLESLPDPDDQGDYFAAVSGDGVFVDDYAGILGSPEDTGFNSGMKYFDVYIPDVNMVAHKSGTMSAPGLAVSKAYENKKGSIIAYVNSDNDDAGPAGSHDYDNQAIGAGDNDIIKLTLKKFLPTELKKGTLEMTIMPSETAVRIFKSATSVLDDRVMNLASPVGNELYPMTYMDMDVYVEVLEYIPEIKIKLAYKDPSGRELCSDTICITPSIKVDLDVDSNNDGAIDPDDNGEDEFESFAPGRIICVDRHGDGDFDDLAPMNIKLYPTPTTGWLVLRADSGGEHIRIWKDAFRAEALALGEAIDLANGCPSQLWIDGESEGLVDLRLEYFLDDGQGFNLVAMDQVSVCVIRTISWSPAGLYAYTWEPCGWLGDQGGTGFQAVNKALEEIKDQGWEVTVARRYIMSYEFDDVGACTLENFKAMSLGGFVIVSTHGGPGAIHAIYLSTEAKVDDWIEGESDMVSIESGEVPGRHAAEVAANWFKDNWATELDEQNAITYWIACSSGTGDAGSIAAQAGGRIKLGYEGATCSGAAVYDSEGIFGRMNGRIEAGSKRSLHEAWKPGGYDEMSTGFDATIVKYGNDWTTLCPAPVAVFPSETPGLRKGWGCIIFDTYMDDNVAPETVLEKMSGGCSVSNLRWLDNGSGKYGIGFDFDNTGGAGATMRVISSEGENKADPTGVNLGRKLDGNRVRPNADDMLWTF